MDDWEDCCNECGFGECFCDLENCDRAAEGTHFIDKLNDDYKKLKETKNKKKTK